jgi:hypothetical protein
MFLDGKPNETIIFRMRAEAPKSNSGELWIPFKADSSPIVTALAESTMKDLSPDWPDDKIAFPPKTQ